MKTVHACLVLSLGAVALLTGCERPPMQSQQLGYRGTGMDQISNPRLVEQSRVINEAPAPLPPVPEGGPPASSVFKNVPLLGHLSIAEFTRTMAAMTTWVAPEQGCVYCHAPGQDLSSDALYTKVVSRRMIEMTRDVNTNYKSHVADTGVTCFTCHRGNPVPPEIWFRDAGPRTASGIAGNRAGQNFPSPHVNLSSLPYDPFTPFFEQGQDIRVVSTTALPTTDRSSIKQTEWTYALMINMSQALGVNCTYCHNTRSFSSWESSSPQRAVSYYAIRMVRNINGTYLDPVGKLLPADHMGPLGDGPKVACATCHAGVYKPLFGAQMMKHYPAFMPAAPGAATTASATPSPEVTAMFAVVYFAVSSPDVNSEFPAALAPMIAVLKADPKIQATISGYHSASGDAAVNQELAKTRATRVQAILVAQGIPETRLILVKPIAEQGNIAGEDPKARRVEVSLK